MIATLAQVGADVNAARGDTGSTALMLAVQFNEPPCVKALIEAGADLDKANFDGSYPVWFAADKGYTECLGLLLDAGADWRRAWTDVRTGTAWTPLANAK